MKAEPRSRPRVGVVVDRASVLALIGTATLLLLGSVSSTSAQPVLGHVIRLDSTFSQAVFAPAADGGLLIGQRRGNVVVTVSRHGDTVRRQLPISLPMGAVWRVAGTFRSNYWLWSAAAGFQLVAEDIPGRDALIRGRSLDTTVRTHSLTPRLMLEDGGVVVEQSAHTGNYPSLMVEGRSVMVLYPNDRDTISVLNQANAWLLVGFARGGQVVPQPWAAIDGVAFLASPHPRVVVVRQFPETGIVQLISTLVSGDSTTTELHLESQALTDEDVDEYVVARRRSGFFARFADSEIAEQHFKEALYRPAWKPIVSGALGLPTGVVWLRGGVRSGAVQWYAVDLAAGRRCTLHLPERETIRAGNREQLWTSAASAGETHLMLYRPACDWRDHP